MQSENIVLVKQELIIPNPNQPRKKFNDTSLNELAKSIKEYGILNPILVRKKDNLYEIIAGERRYRAAKIAGLTEIPVIIKEVEDSKVAELALIENIQRENITPMEEAKTYDEILKNANLTEQQLGEYIGKSQSSIANKLRLLKLPIEVQEAINNKKISEKHARSLLTIEDKNKQIELLKRIINEKLSVKELDNIIIEKKEEKESDNMNNGNFFPNMNSQDNNVSLNQMNMQAMPGITNEVPQAPIQTNEPIISEPTPVGPVLPTQPEIAPINPLPQVEIQNMEPPVATPEPIMPELNSAPVSPIPEFGVNAAPTMADNVQNPTSMVGTISPEPQPMPAAPVETPNQPIDIPLFGDNNQVGQVETTPTPVLPETNTEAPVIAPGPVEQPLFNQELNNSAGPNLNESFYEVPVNVSPVIETPEADKFTQVKQLLSSNNIEYKAYSNETGHCIIIEL